MFLRHPKLSYNWTKDLGLFETWNSDIWLGQNCDLQKVSLIVERSASKRGNTIPRPIPSASAYKTQKKAGARGVREVYIIHASGLSSRTGFNCDNDQGMMGTIVTPGAGEYVGHARYAPSYSTVPRHVPVRFQFSGSDTQCGVTDPAGRASSI